MSDSFFVMALSVSRCIPITWINWLHSVFLPQTHPLVLLYRGLQLFAKIIHELVYICLSLNVDARAHSSEYLGRANVYNRLWHGNWRRFRCRVLSHRAGVDLIIFQSILPSFGLLLSLHLDSPLQLEQAVFQFFLGGLGLQHENLGNAGLDGQFFFDQLQGP